MPCLVAVPEFTKCYKVLRPMGAKELWLLRAVTRDCIPVWSSSATSAISAASSAATTEKSANGRTVLLLSTRPELHIHHHHYPLESAVCKTHIESLSANFVAHARVIPFAGEAVSLFVLGVCRCSTNYLLHSPRLCVNRYKPVIAEGHPPGCPSWLAQE